MSQATKIVITGIGAVTPIGIGVETYWRGLLQKKSGIKIRVELAQTDWPLKLYSPVDDFDGKQWVDS